MTECDTFQHIYNNEQFERDTNFKSVVGDNCYINNSNKSNMSLYDYYDNYYINLTSYYEINEYNKLINNFFQ